MAQGLLGHFLGSKGSWCIGLTTLPPSCANCLEIREPQPPGTLRACNGIAFYDRLACSIISLMFCVQKNIPKNCIPILRLEGKNNNNKHI
jgi:hypothetical protein